jgi:integrase
VAWCGRQQINPRNPTLILFANYLSFLYQSGLASQSLTQHKAAIIFNLSMQDVKFQSWYEADCLRRIIKGVFNRTPVNRVTYIWNVDQLLDHIRKWGPNSELSVKRLLQKSLSLLALVSACRVSELANLSSQVVKRPGVWTFKFLKWKKNSSVKNSCLDLNIFAFHQELVCPLAGLSAYLDATKGHRQDTLNVFLTLQAPFRAARANTLARHLKSVLKEAGIDINRFSAHSYRSASTSKSLCQGVPIGDILARATWSSPSTFNRFYAKKPSLGLSFSEAVLSPSL